MTHVVFFRFTDSNDADEAALRLRALQGRVPSLLEIECGIDEFRTERSWDLCLITRFANRAGLDAYQVHPAHQDILKFIGERASSLAAVDWSTEQP